MSPKKIDNKSSRIKEKTASGGELKAFTEEERLAMKEHVLEFKKEASRGPHVEKSDGETEVLTKIEQMSEPDRSMGKRLHSIVKASAPSLTPRLWYGMPAYGKDGKVVCYFQCSQKFRTRYSTLGFSDSARLDEGDLWPVAFALKKLTASEKTRISALIKKAAS